MSQSQSPTRRSRTDGSVDDDEEEEEEEMNCFEEEDLSTHLVPDFGSSFACVTDET